ncbi:MAG: HAMP domain-containing histidine kinase [Actinobacteria bacterium]|nr:HAMP domain-containing histidine kinase [Actinomycetota bacterium]
MAERLHGERLAVLGRMSSYLSNKVNKALAAAVGYSELALAADGMPGQAKDDLKVASAELVQAGRALRDLLFFMEAPDVKPAPCDLNLVVAESVEVSRPAAVARGVAITATLDRALPSIPFDGPHLRRLCDELLANALAATPSGRAIAVYTGRGATHAVIGFVDQGDGIPPHVQDQLFEPFATEKYSGLSTGMGLLVVQSINRAHGWEIDVRTDTEAGTAISITIPLTTQAETRPADSVAARA